MTSPPTELTCDHCGYKFTPDAPVNWCPKCARRIFATAKQRKRHRINTLYLGAMAIGATALLAYLFFELIIVPILAMKPPS